MAGRWPSSPTRAAWCSGTRTGTRSSALLEVVAPGNALAVLDASQSGAKGPTPKRLADAIAAAGGTVRQFKSPREGALAGWIEAEARERGLQLAAGSAKALAERVGGFVREADAERGQQTRLASMELDKLGLYRGTEPITPDDVAALVPEAIPGSVWAFTDAVGRATPRPGARGARPPARRRPRSRSSWPCSIGGFAS